jgi:hypothetical protein
MLKMEVLLVVERLLLPPSSQPLGKPVDAATQMSLRDRNDDASVRLSALQPIGTAVSHKVNQNINF